MRGELEPKYIPQLLLGSLLGAHWSAIGQLISVVPSNSPKSLRKFILSSFLLVFILKTQTYFEFG